MPSKKRGKDVEPVTRPVSSLSENIQIHQAYLSGKSAAWVKYLQERKVQEKFLGNHEIGSLS